MRWGHRRGHREVAPTRAALGAGCLGLLVLCLAGCIIVPDPPGEGPRSTAGVPTHYTVLPGDTLYAIAFRLGLDWRDLARWNGLDNPSLIHPGQRLVLKGKKTSTQVATRSAPTNRRTQRTSTSARQSPPSTSKKAPAAAAPKPSAPPPATDHRWRWPAKGPLVATFSDPAEAGRGIDLGGRAGDGVRAAAGGRVVYSGNGLRYYGNLVIIKHDDTFLSAYGYNDSLLVAQGDEVKAGQRIARMGLGPGKQPRLHFEIRVNGKPVDPLRYLPPRESGR